MKAFFSVLLAAGVISTITVSTVWAQTVGPAASALPPSATEGLLHSLFGLAVVIAMIFGAGWLIKRVRPQLQARSSLQVLSSASVGTRERVVLVRYLDEVMVLGVAPGQVSLLKTSPAPVDLAPSCPLEAPSFLERLRGAMKVPRV